MERGIYNFSNNRPTFSVVPPPTVVGYCAAASSASSSRPHIHVLLFSHSITWPERDGHGSESRRYTIYLGNNTLDKEKEDRRREFIFSAVQPYLPIDAGTLIIAVADEVIDKIRRFAWFLAVRIRSVRPYNPDYNYYYDSDSDSHSHLDDEEVTYLSDDDSLLDDGEVPYLSDDHSVLDDEEVAYLSDDHSVLDDEELAYLSDDHSVLDDEEVTYLSDDHSVPDGEQVTYLSDDHSVLDDEEVAYLSDDHSVLDDEEVAYLSDHHSVLDDEELAYRSDDHSVLDDEELAYRSDDHSVLDDEELAYLSDDHSVLGDEELTYLSNDGVAYPPVTTVIYGENSGAAVAARGADQKRQAIKWLERTIIEYDERDCGGEDGEKSGGGCCVICLEELTAGTEVAVMPCNHCSFHDGCLSTWLERSLCCPLCRRKISGPMLPEPEPFLEHHEYIS